MTDARGPFFQDGANSGKTSGSRAAIAFNYTNKTVFADIIKRLEDMHRSYIWFKGLDADTVDGCHCSDLQVSVNGTVVESPNLNDTTPAAPSGGLNGKWQASGSDVSVYVPFSSLATVTAVSTDKVVITDASDSENPKRALISDITAMVAVPSAASTTEVLTGTDSAKFGTPDSIAALWEKGGDIASAGTISVGEGGYFFITGTTTITDIDFGTDKTGRKVWLKFDGALTLTHHATTLILPTGANITTAAGDTACFVSEGSGNVRCIAYQRADGTALAGSGSGAPVDAQYVTLVTNGTLTNERTLAVGTGLDLTDGGAGNAATIDLDLNELTTATAAALDHVVFVDADDNGSKKTTMPDLAAALSATTAGSTIADNAAVRGDGGTRGVQSSAFVINDVSGASLGLTTDGTVTTLLSLKPADTLAVATGPSMLVDAGFGSATPGAVNIGTTTAESVSISRTGKTTTINGTGRVDQMVQLAGVYSGAAGDDVAVGAVSCFRVTSGSTLTGMVPAAGGTAVDGQLMVVVNETGGNITLSHDTTSAAANRLFMAGGANLTISRYSAALFRYSTSDSRWRHVGEAGGGTGGGINEGVSAGLNFWGAW